MCFLSFVGFSKLVGLKRSHQQMWSQMGVSKNSDYPQKWMVKIMENPIKMGWFGGGKPFKGWFPSHPRYEGIFCGTSGGATVATALEVTDRPGEGKDSRCFFGGWLGDTIRMVYMCKWYIYILNYIDIIYMHMDTYAYDIFFKGVCTHWYWGS